jgi:pimeloyl-ACP methyl ester carboxylesterase
VLPVALHADDAAAILAAVGNGPAYVYGNSGGGTIGRKLVTRHPELVRAFVAHEAPITELLPDAARWRAGHEDISQTYRAEGVIPAMGKFGTLVEEGGPKYSEEMQQTPPTPEDQEMMGRMAGNSDLFLAHELRQITGYVPDVDALRNVSTRIVSAAGETSGEQGARRAAVALAERLGIAVTYLPGGHGGWGSDPQEFVERLHEVLQEARQRESSSRCRYRPDWAHDGAVRWRAACRVGHFGRPRSDHRSSRLEPSRSAATMASPAARTSSRPRAAPVTGMTAGPSTTCAKTRAAPTAPTAVASLCLANMVAPRGGA